MLRLVSATQPRSGEEEEAEAERYLKCSQLEQVALKRCKLEGPELAVLCCSAEARDGRGYRGPRSCAHKGGAAARR
jgi:hypothetical protein